MGLVRHQYAAKDEADRGEKVQLHGNRDDKSSPELKEFNLGQHETDGHVGPGVSRSLCLKVS